MLPTRRENETSSSTHASPARIIPDGRSARLPPSDAVLAESARRMNESVGGKTTQTRRTRAAMARFFVGLAMIEPGLVPLNRWRPGPDEPALGKDIPAVAAIARKP